MSYRCLIGLLLASAFCAVAQAASLEEKIFAPYPIAAEIDSQEHELSLLSQADRNRYHEIFRLQDSARWSEANKRIAQISNPILHGHVRFQRLMHPTGYRSSFAELADWLDAYADLPGAERVYRLAKKRRPAGNRRMLATPVKQTNLAGYMPEPKLARKNAEEPDSRTIRNILHQIDQHIGNGRVTVALNLLRQKWHSALAPQDYVRALGLIAKGYVLYDRDAKAIAVGVDARRRDAHYPSQAHWWAGLAAWRMQDYATAADFFIFLGSNPSAQPDMAAAASFWGWRAAMRLGQITRAHTALLTASRDGYSFYGQLARHALGVPDQFDWNLKADVNAANGLITAHPVLQRILALTEIGEYALAQAEFQQIRFEETPGNLSLMMFVADRAGLANAVINLGKKQLKKSGMRHDISRYPVPRWQFLEHYSIDRALLYGLILQESRFQVAVESHASARGLMQIIPETAGKMQKRLRLPVGDYYDPAMNLTLGQEYLKMLLRLPEIDYNLIYTLAGYNAGPGRLRDWRKKSNFDDDPLLFIETIPVRETRTYIEHVLSNLWIYRKRLDQPTPGIEMLLEGKWPLYQRFDVAG